MASPARWRHWITRGCCRLSTGRRGGRRASPTCAARWRGWRIRRDARWNVPEPELALVISPAGKLVGYTLGNDMSSRDIEGENPLYLPQAKVYDGCCALGPAVLLADEPLPKSTE